MPIFTTLISSLAPIFLVLSPLTSYTDQILSIHRTRTSAGFSLDIPLIMLVASILKIFYWPGARYDLSLLVQAIVMVGVQVVLLKVALDNRPGWRGEMGGMPFSAGKNAGGERERLWGFWRWRGQRPWVCLPLSRDWEGWRNKACWESAGLQFGGCGTDFEIAQRRYWEFLLYLTGLLTILHLFLQPTSTSPYTQLIGYVGLAIEAILPLPQILANQRARSCKGFRVSVLANWLIGDTMKMSYFFTSAPGKVPWAFKACGIFQACCDAGLGVQWLIYGDGPEVVAEKDVRLS